MEDIKIDNRRQNSPGTSIGQTESPQFIKNDNKKSHHHTHAFCRKISAIIVLKSIYSKQKIHHTCKLLYCLKTSLTKKKTQSVDRAN